VIPFRSGDEEELRFEKESRHVTEVSDLYDDSPEGIVLRIHVQPGAGRSAVVGRHGDALKIRVAAPPVEGRANEAAQALLAEVLGVSKADVELTSGQSSRTKRFRLNGLDAEEGEKRIRVALDDAKAADTRGARGRG
jgi:uncharacterized protein (TIGR00251 family)